VDGRRLSFVPWDNRQVKLYELADLTIAQRVALPPQARSRVHHTGHAVFSPDGEMVGVFDHDGVYIYLTSKPAASVLLPLDVTSPACFAPDGSALFTGGAKGAQRWPIKWSADRSELHLGPSELLEPTRDQSTSAVDVSRDGRWILAQTKSDVLGFDIEHPSAVVLYGKRIPLYEAPDLSPDGRWVTILPRSRDRLQIWNARSGALVTNLLAPAIWQSAFSPDSRWLACSQKDSIIIFDTANWAVRRRIPHSPEDVGHGLAFNHDGQLLATFASDWKVRLLRSETGEELAEFPAGRATTSVRFNATGDRLAVVNESGYFDLWDLRRVREQLAALNLDWDMPPYPPTPTSPASLPFEVIVHTNAPAN
jgi:WD40 repeat protein